ncbi:hypothetical protein K0504_09735 [Neiella marina]|uniref:RING-type E3 ubiquitin transferase n=1 Tax=Neiella holothuriorum TaxID=2870530 RepID=A0ABS7EI47_9GAMM|nr:hypothetical protein [Neiella holothuriorum]MBW8191317.1 hypothetical protein [Neiella holothuriorum]
MGYLQVMVQVKASDKWTCVFRDLSPEELRKLFVKPFFQGKSIFYDGEILQPHSISQIKITETDKRHTEELSILREKSESEIKEFNSADSGVVLISLGYGYEDYEVMDSGKDVTSLYIKAPSVLHGFVKEPWVVSIVTGLLLLLVGAIFGL